MSARPGSPPRLRPRLRGYLAVHHAPQQREEAIGKLEVEKRTLERELQRHNNDLRKLAGKDGLDIIKPLIAQAHKYLRPGAILALEFGYDQADAVRDLIAACGAYHEPRLIRDHQQIERSAVAVKK